MQAAQATVPVDRNGLVPFSTVVGFSISWSRLERVCGGGEYAEEVGVEEEAGWNGGGGR